MNNSDYTRQVSTMCQEFSDTRRILCAIAHFVDRNVHVLKKINCADIHTARLQAEGENVHHQKQSTACLGQTDTQGSSVPPSGGVKVEGSAAQAMAEKSRRPLICAADPLTLTQTSRMWFLCEMCSRGAVKVLQAGSDSQF